MSQEITTVNTMLEGEKILQQYQPSVLILRLGGLMGYNRIAGRYSADKPIKFGFKCPLFHSVSLHKKVDTRPRFELEILNSIQKLETKKRGK